MKMNKSTKATTVYDCYQYNIIQSNIIQDNILGRIREVSLENSENLNEFSPEVSFFKNLTVKKPTKTINLLDFVLTDEYKNQVDRIRKTNNKDLQKALKSQLPAITPSGTFKRRRNGELIQYSGIICIDIDGKDNPDIKDWDMLKKSLSDIQGLFYAGLSAGGNGIFLMIRIAYPDKHLKHFLSIEKELQSRGIVIDSACKDVARLRFASFDAQPYFCTSNGAYLHFEEKPPQIASNYPKSYANNTDSRVEELIEKIEYLQLDITRHYRDWFAIGRSLASEFGEAGRNYFHRISYFYSNYSENECDKQFDKCLQNCSQTSIRTFFYHCKNYDLTTI